MASTEDHILAHHSRAIKPMTADRTTPDGETQSADSTPRRGFGWARSVLRAVKGAVEATRNAARSFTQQVEVERQAIEARRAQRQRLREQAQQRAKAPSPERPIVPLEDRLPFMPLEIRRLFMDVMGRGWAAMQPKLTR